MALCLESIQVVHHLAAEKRAAVFQCRFIDDDLRTFGLDALHHALDARLAEVVRVRLHRQAVHADDTLPLFGRVEVPTVVVVVVTGRVQYAVGNEILTGFIAFHDGLDEVFRNILIISQQLLGVLGQAVAAVTERRVVVMASDAWVKAYAVDDGFRVQTLHLGIRVQFVEVGDPQGQVSVGKEFHGLGFGQAHEQRVDVFLDGSFLQEGCKIMCGLVQPGIPFGTAHDDAARVEVVIQGFALAQEFWREDDVFRTQLFAHAFRIPHGNGTFNDHYRMGIDFLH